MKLLNPLEKLLYAEQSVANTALSSINHKGSNMGHWFMQ
jgi:hypothetical protein